MGALKLFDAPVAPAPRRRLYAVRGTVGEASVAAPPASRPELRLAPVPLATPTLDAMLGSAWSSLAEGFTACPVCHEETMTARWTAGHGIAGGRCASCHTILD